MPRKTRVTRRLPRRRQRFNEAAARCRGKLQGTWGRLTLVGRRFNEAAARCRGKRIRMCSEQETETASMRPRPDAAENRSNFSEYGQRIQRLQ